MSLVKEEGRREDSGRPLSGHSDRPRARNLRRPRRASAPMPDRTRAVIRSLPAGCAVFTPARSSNLVLERKGRNCAGRCVIARRFAAMTRSTRAVFGLQNPSDRNGGLWHSRQGRRTMPQPPFLCGLCVQEKKKSPRHRTRAAPLRDGSSGGVSVPRDSTASRTPEIAERTGWNQVYRLSAPVSTALAAFAARAATSAATFSFSAAIRSSEAGSPPLMM